MSTLKTNRIEPVGSTAGSITVDGNMVFTQGATFPGGICSGATSSFAGTVFVNGTVAMSSPFTFRNRIINGDMRINQRAITTNPVFNGFGMTMGTVNITSQTTNKTYDMWYFQRSPGITFWFIGGVTASPPPGFNSYTRILSGATAQFANNASVSTIFQPIEASNIADFDYGKSTAKTTTVSFWARSNRTGIFEGNVSSYSTGTRGYLFPYTINSANTWEYKSVTIPGDTDSSSGAWNYNSAIDSGIGGGPNINGINHGFAYLGFNIGAGLSGYGTRNTWQTRSGAYAGFSPYTDGTGVQIAGFSGGYLDITGVQWELGSVATPFELRPHQVEQALCSRYFQRLIYFNYAGYNETNAGCVQTFNFSPMRITPSTTYYSSLTLSNCYIPTGGGLVAASPTNGYISVKVTSTGGFQIIANAQAGIDLSAEL